MDSEAMSARRQQISNATLRRMSGTNDPYWTVGRCIATVLVVIFTCIAIALAL